MIHQQIMRASQWFCGKREHGHLFQENKGYFGINLREQGISLLLEATLNKGEKVKFLRDQGYPPQLLRLKGVT